VRASISTLESTGVWNGLHNKRAIFQYYGVSKTRGYEILRTQPDSDRTFPRTDEKETRGAKRIITSAYIQKMEDILAEGDVQDKAMSWKTLGIEAGIKEASERTIQRALGRLDYHKCVACRRSWVSTGVRQRRVEYAKEMLSKYPRPEDWLHVRFSDEVHFGLGPQGKLMIIRRPGERYCHNCIQEENEPQEKERKKLHAWAAVGYDFKSPLVWYDIPTNTNGKMTKKVYEEEILEKHVKQWLVNGDDFVLEEDQDSGHGIGPNHRNSHKCPIQRWKQAHGLKAYFNASSSLDLAPIENAWQPVKQYIRKFSHWQVEETRELAAEGWYNNLSQEWINECILTMPARLQAVIDGEGRLTGF